MKTLSKEKARAYYDHLGAKQDTQGFYEDPATEDMVSHAEFSNAQTVFEYGCGTGRFAERLLEQYVPSTGQYLGIDLSPRMVELAQARLCRFGHRAEVRVTDGSLPVTVPSAALNLQSAWQSWVFPSEVSQLQDRGVSRRSSWCNCS